MIKFYRQIRQSLIMENKTAKYLKYAIGEIVLVVIGILIALQINNWNEQRKNEITKQIYLKSLIAELRNNYKVYLNVQQGYDRRIASFDHLFNTINTANASKDSIKKAFDEAVTFIGITLINKTAFDELINSQNFQVFEKDLRDKIMIYYNELHNTIERINMELSELRELRLEMYKSIDIAYESGYKDKEYEEIMDWKTKPDSPQFLKATNFFASRKNMLLSTSEMFKDLMTESENLIAEFQKHLKN